MIASPLPPGECPALAVGMHASPDPGHARAAEESAAEAVTRMAGGFAMTQVLHTAVQAGIADFIGDRTCTSAEVGRALGLHLGALNRFLRMMAVLDLLVQEGPDRFSLSDAGQLLRADHPASMRERILYIGAVNYPVSGAAMHALRTGATAFQHVFGQSFFDHLATQPGLGRAFNGLMQRGIEERAAGILGAYDFSRVHSIVDIGGGNGSLLSIILSNAQRAKGILFDAPAVIAEARESAGHGSAGSRIEFVAGDMFRDAYPVGADLYLLSCIIHDWDDARAQQILRRCAQAMRRDSELLLIEQLMPASVLHAPSAVASDYSMLLLTGGLERSEAQYAHLLERSGLVLSGVTPLAMHSRVRSKMGAWALVHCHAR